MFSIFPRLTKMGFQLPSNMDPRPQAEKFTPGLVHYHWLQLWPLYKDDYCGRIPVIRKYGSVSPVPIEIDQKEKKKF